MCIALNVGVNRSSYMTTVHVNAWDAELYGGCPAMKRVSDGRVMAVREDETSFRISKEWVVS